jgi:hypothetical protein
MTNESPMALLLAFIVKFVTVPPVVMSNIDRPFLLANCNAFGYDVLLTNPLICKRPMESKIIRSSPNVLKRKDALFVLPKNWDALTSAFPLVFHAGMFMVVNTSDKLLSSVCKVILRPPVITYTRTANLSVESNVVCGIGIDV